MIEFPKKKYSIILADPPWAYKDRAAAGKRGACFKYPTMTMAEICALPINKISAENALLFLWVTMPILNQVWSIFSNWDFTYKTCAFTWIKTNVKAVRLSGVWVIGLDQTLSYAC